MCCNSLYAIMVYMENKGLNTISSVNDGENLGIKKPYEFEMYALWLALPPLLKNPMGNVDARKLAMSMGIEEETILDLISIPTNQVFAEKFDIHINTLTDWKKIIKEKGMVGLPIMKNWAQTMSSNLLMSLYQHAMKKGNPLTIKLWFQLVENWTEKTKLELTLSPVVHIEHEQYD